MAVALLVLIFLSSLTPAAAAPALAAPPAAGLDELQHAVAAFSPREEGSPAEGALLDWIAARMAGNGWATRPFDFSHSDFEHSFSRNLRVDVPGRSRDTLLLAVPIDAPAGPGSAGDGSAGIALAVEMLDRLKGSVPPRSLVVLFLGAEFGDSGFYPMGSTLFLRDFQPDYPVSMLYLDLRQARGRVLVRGSGRGIVTPYWMMKRCVDALEVSGTPYRLQGDEVQAFRLDATQERTQIEPWLRAGIPAIGLEVDGSSAADGAPDLLPALSSFLTAFLSTGSDGGAAQWDRHYFLAQLGRRTFIVGETGYVAFFGGTLAVILLFALIWLRRLKKYTRILIRNSGAILPLAVLAFALLVAGTYAVTAIPVLRGFPDEWKFAPLEFLGLKIVVALFLCAVLYAPLRYLPFPRNGSFYSAGALLFLILEIGVVAVFDISFTPYFLWALLFIFASTLARNRWVKLALALPAPVWAVRAVVTNFLLPAYPLSHVLTFSPLLGNLIVAGAFLPFILVVLRLALLFPARGRLRSGVRELILAGALFAAAGLETARLLTFSPFSPENPQPLVATETVLVDAGGATSSTFLGIDSPAPVRRVSLSTPQGTRTVPSGWNGQIPLSPVASPLRVTVGIGQFLRQLNLSLDVAMSYRPREFTMSVDSAQDFVLYDSSFPAVRVGPRSYRLLVGAFPPNPLPLQLTLPVDQSFTITITAEFDCPLIGVDVNVPPDARLTTRVRVVRTLDVKT